MTLPIGAGSSLPVALPFAQLILGTSRCRFRLAWHRIIGNIEQAIGLGGQPGLG
jgi:hypothetical protein